MNLKPNEFCRVCGHGILHGYSTLCDTCKDKEEALVMAKQPCMHNFESFKGNGYETDTHICRKCGERRTV